jgi:hypothetical protein
LQFCIVIAAVAWIAQLMRTEAVFERTARAVGVLASFATFERLAGESVAEGLETRKKSLEILFRDRDHALFCPDPEYRQKLMIEASRKILEGQRSLDYAVAIAYLAGFGKIARKFTK